MINNSPVICSYDTPDVMMRCYRQGVIETSEPMTTEAEIRAARKRVFLIDRNDPNLLPMAATVSKADKTFQMYAYPSQVNGKMCVLAFDDTGNYHADSFDFVGLDTVTFPYAESNLQSLGERDILLHRLIVGVDRTVRKSFCNWLLGFKLQNNKGTACYVKNYAFLNAKSFIMDIADNWSGTSYIGVGRIEFYDTNGNLIPLSSGFTAYATSQYSTSFGPAYAFNTSLSKTGDWGSAAWVSLSGTYTNQRLICVFTTVRNIGYVVINNGHDYDQRVELQGAKNVKMYFSTASITSTVYDSTIASSELFFDGQIRPHLPNNTIDDIPVYFNNGKVQLLDSTANLIDYTDAANSAITIGSSILLSTGQRATIKSIDDGWVEVSPMTYLAYGPIIPIESIGCVFTDGGITEYRGVAPFSCELDGLEAHSILIGENLSSTQIDEESFVGVDGLLTFQITIDHNNIDETLTNFPLTLIITDPRVFDEIGDNYYKFQILSGLVQCYVEIERWVASEVKAVLHIRVPEINSDVDTTLTFVCSILLADNTDYIGRTGTPIAWNVWDANYGAVYTMAQDPALGGYVLIDSTSNRNHGTSVGSMTTSDVIDGLISKATEFDGSNDYINIAHSTSISIAGDITIEVMCKPTNINSVYQKIISKDSAEIYFNYGIQTSTLSTAMTAIYNYGTSGTSRAYVNLTSENVLNVWGYYASTVSMNGLKKGFRDGIKNSEAAYNYSVLQTTTTPLRIGCNGSAGQLFYGGIEHIRISNISRSEAWIKATNLSLRNQLATFTLHPDSVAAATLNYALSFDNRQTYKVWIDTEWRAIVSNLESVHGIVGDTDWYYRDNADIWSKAGLNENDATNAISQACAHSNNQMNSLMLNGLTATEFNATGGFVAAEGYFNVAVNFSSSQPGIGAEIQSLSINDTKQVWVIDPIDLSVITTSITSSEINWGYSIIDGFDFGTSVKIYALITGGTEWLQCTNSGSIPGVTTNMTTTGKYLHIKIVADKLDETATIDPALLVLSLTIR